MTSDRVLVSVLVISLGLEVYRGWGKTGQTPFPAPSLFVGVAIVFTVLGVLASVAPGLAAAFAVAFLLGMIVYGKNPIAPVLPVNQPAQSRAPGTQNGGTARGITTSANP